MELMENQGRFRAEVRYHFDSRANANIYLLPFNILGFTFPRTDALWTRQQWCTHRHRACCVQTYLMGALAREEGYRHEESVGCDEVV